jgi:adhesin/invasin
VLDALPADDESETTIIAILSSADGFPIDDEEIRFVVREGLGYLGDRVGDELAAEGEHLGNGIYATRFRTGDVDGNVTVAALWVSSTETELPEVSTSIELVSAGELSIEVDDDNLLPDENDEATIVAYVLDGLNRPVDDADVTFRLIEGSGRLQVVDRDGSVGRYAAVFRPTGTPGRAVVEVALPEVSDVLRERVTIGVLEVADLETIVFPDRVAVRQENRRAELLNSATILVAIRNSDGELVRGLDPDDLIAQVVAGPGEVTNEASEIKLASGRGSGVYTFSFAASDLKGSTTIRIVPLQNPGATNTVSIRTVTEIGEGEVSDVIMEAFADEPFQASREEEVLVVTMAADRRGNPVTGLDPDFRIIRGQGTLSRQELELDSEISGIQGTGIYLTTLNTGLVGVDSVSEVRSLFSTNRGDLRTQSVGIFLGAINEPRVIVFPPKVSSDHDAVAVIDIFDADTRSVSLSDRRYQLDLDGGVTGLLEEPSNNGRFPDLVSGDNISSALFEVNDASGDNQVVRLSVLDLDAPGYPFALTSFTVGQVIDLSVTASPESAEQGELVEIIAFAKDEFGNPAIDHELVLTVEAGGALVLNSGKMSDTGGRVSDFEDPYADDGMYVGAIEVLGASTSPIRIRITDTTPASQPTVTVTVNDSSR